MDRNNNNNLQEDISNHKFKKRTRTVTIEADFSDFSIVVNYEVEEPIFGDRGQVLRVEKQLHKKRIKVKVLNENTNIRSLAEDIVKKCRLIAPSKLDHVEGLLHELQRRKFEDDYRLDGEKDSEILRRQREERERREGARMEQEGEFEPANIEDVDSYMELLYENETEKKAKGAQMIMQLARRSENLEALISNEPLLSSLTRVLKDDGKKSMDLLIHILYVFYSFSHFSQFHHIITTYHVGETVMKTIDYEIKRQGTRLADLKKKHQEVKSMDRSSPEYKTAKEELAVADKRFRLFMRKQDKLLYVCFHILLNLAEDVNIERKMKKRQIVSYLVKILERESNDLLVLALTFLKKLSIFRENKNEMAEAKIIEKLARFIPCENELLLNVSLRLLLNLSFDPALRNEMINCNMVPKLVQLLRNPNHLHVVLKLLYHMSMDDGCKSLFTYTEAIPLILEMIVEYPEPLVNKELIALAVNLTTNARNAEIMCENAGLKRLIERLLQTRDSLLAKVVRNISQHETKHKELFRRYIADFISIAKKTENSDLLVELLGILGNMVFEDFSFAKLIEQFGLIDFLCKLLVPGYSEDDIVLEVVIFIGTITTDARCAGMIVRSPLVRALLDLVIEKQEDDEMILQIMYTFYKFMLQEDTRVFLLGQTQIVPYLIDLLQDNNDEIRKMADQLLDIIMDHDEDWAVRIRKSKFAIHNAQWLDVIEEEELSLAAGGSGSGGWDAEGTGNDMDDDVDHDGTNGSPMSGYNDNFYNDDEAFVNSLMH